MPAGHHFAMRTEVKARMYTGVAIVGFFGGMLLGWLIGLPVGVALFAVGAVAIVLWGREERRRQRELTGLDQARLADLWRAGRSGRAPEDPRLDRAALVWAEYQRKQAILGAWTAPALTAVGGVLGYFTGFPRDKGWESVVSWVVMGTVMLGAQLFQRKRVSRMRAEVEKRAPENETVNSS
ncbi:hypothetical protein ACIBF1_31285 [Spirillospora sp. NPDC050679]